MKENIKVGVVIFPGSNCDRDIIHVCKNVMNFEVVELWHKDESLNGLTENDIIFLPGGFSFGDYLRSGAIARFSPIMKKVVEFAEMGGKLIGICNGFQILCEAGLLPGALIRNKKQLFSCKNVYLKVENNQTAFTRGTEKNEVLKIPIAHAEGSYYADNETVTALKNNDQIIFTYCDENGNATESSNPNGSVANIAGICNKKRTIFGMMPHPERASEKVLGNTDGLKLLESIVNIKESVEI